MPEAISADDLLAFRIAGQAQTKVKSMLTLAAQHVDAFPLSDGDEDTVYDVRSSTGVPLTCVNFDLPDGHWLAADQDSVLPAATATTNAATPWGEEEPRFLDGDAGRTVQPLDARRRERLDAMYGSGVAAADRSRTQSAATGTDGEVVDLQAKREAAR